MKITIRPSTIASVALAAGLLSGCTIQLAPAYDPGIVDELNRTNANALALLTSLEQGVKSTEYPKYDAQFSQVIGGYKALRARMSNRAVPAPGKTFVEKAGGVVTPEGKALLGGVCSNPADCVYAAPKVVDSIVGTLTMVQATLRQKGFAPATGSCAAGSGTAVLLYECPYQHEAMQALYIESILKR